MNDVVGPRQASIQTRQLIRAARTALGFDDSQPSEESSALVVPGSEARDRAFVQLVLAHIRGDAAACADCKARSLLRANSLKRKRPLGRFWWSALSAFLLRRPEAHRGLGGTDGRI